MSHVLSPEAPGHIPIPDSFDHLSSMSNFLTLGNHAIELKTKQNNKNPQTPAENTIAYSKLIILCWAGVISILSQTHLQVALGLQIGHSQAGIIFQKNANEKFTKLNALAPTYPVLCKSFRTSIVFNKMNICAHHQPPSPFLPIEILSGIFKASLKSKR